MTKPKRLPGQKINANRQSAYLVRDPTTGGERLATPAEGEEIAKRIKEERKAEGRATE
jgi:hypothetical protein